MKAGFGVVDITPRIGVQLYGFGPYLNRHAIAVRDRIEARAAAFESAGGKVVVVGCDLCLFHGGIAAKARKLIREAHPELEDKDILINASHTHSGPALCADPFFSCEEKEIQYDFERRENRTSLNIKKSLY